MNARTRHFSALVYLSLLLVAIGGAVVIVGESADIPALTAAGAWMTAPAAVLMGGAVAVAVIGYGLAGLVAGLTWALCAWRRCRRS